MRLKHILRRALHHYPNHGFGSLSSVKTLVTIWIIAWGGSMLDAVSTIFGVMRLGNIEKNPVVHLLISSYGLTGILMYMPVEAALFAAIPLILLASVARTEIRFDKTERTTIAIAAGISLSFPYLVAVANLVFVFGVR